MPTASWRLRLTYESNASPASPRSSRSTGTSTVGAACPTVIPIAQSLRFGVLDARINLRIDEIENECGQGDRDNDSENDPLDGEIVIRPDGVIQDAADSGVAEDDFHQQRTGQDVADGQSER